MHDECFKQEVERFNQWRKALIMKGVCLSGWKWDLADMAKGDESKFIEDVLNKLDCKCFHVSKHMIGVDSGLLLEIATKDVYVVGIYGMEGVGKTPTTESVFNRLC